MPILGRLSSHVTEWFTDLYRVVYRYMPFLYLKLSQKRVFLRGLNFGKSLGKYVFICKNVAISPVIDWVATL